VAIKKYLASIDTSWNGQAYLTRAYVTAFTALRMCQIGGRIGKGKMSRGEERGTSGSDMPG